MTSCRPRQWLKWLPLAEWWYSSTYNSAIKRSLYEAVYGVQPRQMCIPASHRSLVATVKDFQVKREAMNQLLKEVITVAQHKYKVYVDKQRTGISFQVSQMVFLKLQSYRQLLVAVRKHLKLAHKYFGPFEVVEKIGQVAYKLKLPPGSLVHPVFHVSFA
ncbi:uncharacterized protein LOC141690999 [Apium graveolens]|uniref:uncharacterized protein LOC141690999 n=1 Tax=Apium graveolens TaxID=4045 RepID=UPI003D7B91AB